MDRKNKKILYEKYLEEHGIPKQEQQDSESASDVEVDEEYTSNMRLVLSDSVHALKNLVFFSICITILCLACVGAIVMVYEPLRREVLDMVLPIFFK